MRDRITRTVTVDNYVIMELTPGISSILVNEGELAGKAYALTSNNPHFGNSPITIEFHEVRTGRSFWEQRNMQILATSSTGACYVEEGPAPDWWTHGHVIHGSE